MDYIRLNGADLCYDVCGEGDPLIFVHGFLANGTGPYYAELKRTLAADYRVYSLDMRSHGGSAQVSEDVTLKQCGQDVIALAMALELESPMLVGHSMGGYISLSAAIDDPSCFRALALLTPAVCKREPVPEEFVADFMAARRDPKLMSERFAGMFTNPPNAAMLKILCEAALCLPDPIAEQWMRREWSHNDITGGLSSIPLPVLSVIGTLDMVVPPAVQYEDALRIPRAKVVTFNGEGHMFPVEKPETCLREVRRFFQDVA
jgi:3-oxoadipate enol-lactonase